MVQRDRLPIDVLGVSDRLPVAQLKRVREDFPYLRLTAGNDTRLAALLLGVQQGYLHDLGIYYVTQPSIGESMRVHGEERLLTYREFCERLQDPGQRIWLDRLIQFHLDTARGAICAHRRIDSHRQSSVRPRREVRPGQIQ